MAKRVGDPSVFLITSDAWAALVKVDLAAPGDGLITRDTVSSLDWLNTTVTEDVPPSAIEAGAGGWIPGGWRFATLAEVCDMFSQLGPDPDPCPGSTGMIFPPPPGASIDDHVEFLGMSRDTGMGGVFERSPEFFGWGIADLVSGVFYSVEVQENALLILNFAGGSFLVRNTPQVPQPAPALSAPGLVALSLAIAALALRAHRKRAS